MRGTPRLSTRGITGRGVVCAFAFIVVVQGLVVACAGDTPAPVVTCPAIVEYTGEEQAQASKDLDLLPDDSPVHRFMGDYKQLRAKLRACQ